MRILFFADGFLPATGGAERFLDNLVRRLVERGHEATVLAARQPGMDNRIDAPYQLLRYRRPASKRFIVRRAVIPLFRANARYPADCVHAHGGYPPGYTVELFCRLRRLPWAVRPIGSEIIPGGRIRSNRSLEKRLTRTLCAANCVIAQSVELQEWILDLGVSAEQVVRIPNGVDLESFEHRVVSLNEEPTVAAMGMFFPKKGFDILLEAFVQVRQSIPAARLVIAGDGRERGRLESDVRRLGLKGNVDMPGVLDGESKIRFLQRAWLFVSASRREPYATANLEALAAGLPVVATAVGGNREVVVPGYSGILVPPEDPTAMAKAIIDVLSSKDLRRELARGALEIAERHNWHAIVDRYEAIYEKLAHLRT